MYGLLLCLLISQDDSTFAAPREDVASVKAQLRATREELKVAQEAVAANRVRENQREKDLANAVEVAKQNAAQIDNLNTQLVASRAQPVQQESPFASVGVVVQGLQAIDTPLRTDATRVQWRIFSSRHCAACPMTTNPIWELRTKGWIVSGEENAQFRMVDLTREQWNAAGIQLPRAELWIGTTLVLTRDMPFTANELATEYNRRTANYEQNLAGMKVGELGVKTQVESLLRSLQPFLDGGKLQIVYTPRAGVVKEYLTIAQGNVALRIPARTALNIAMNNSELSGTFESPTPQVRIPVRGNTNVKSFTLTPAKFAIQLPWMIDPEWAIVNGPSSAVRNEFGAAGEKPQDQLDEEIHDGDDVELFGEPRSGHWPTVRAAYNKTHPYCEACGSPDHGNIHHVVPFHNDPSKECDPANLIRLCRDCHFEIGHHRNWKDSNPNVRADSAAHLQDVRGRSNPR